jgi:hypothetical protein
MLLSRNCVPLYTSLLGLRVIRPLVYAYDCTYAGLRFYMFSFMTRSMPNLLL